MFCPHCGNKISANANFCPFCGYDLTKRQIVSPPKREQSTSTKNKSHVKRNVVIVLGLLIIIIICGLFYLNYQNSKVDDSNQNYSASSSQSTSSSSTNNDSIKLSYNLGPKGTAAAITYYAAQHNVEGWPMLMHGSKLDVDLSTNSQLLGSLSDDGQKMAYIVQADGGSGKRMLVYTLDDDNTVNIYSLPLDYDTDKTYKPVVSIAKNHLIHEINSGNGGDKVLSLQDKVKLSKVN